MISNYNNSESIQNRINYYIMYVSAMLDNQEQERRKISS